MTFRTRKVFRLTNKKKIFKEVGEHYLRDDIGCGTQLCEECGQRDGTPLESRHNVTYLIPDSNVLLHQTDWLQSPKVKNIILCQSALRTVRDQSDFMYYRLREQAADKSHCMYVFSNEHHRATHIEKLPNESSEERDFRAVVRAAQWYAGHLKSVAKVILLTNDTEKKMRAMKENTPTRTVHEYVREIGDPELVDLLSGSDTSPDDDNSIIPEGKKEIFPKYLSPETLKEKKQTTSIYEGSIKQDPDNYMEAMVTTDSLDKDILIPGTEYRNRALPGDRVLVELLPEGMWQSPSNVFVDIDIPGRGLEVGSERKGGEGGGDDRIPTGRVVGIVKRNGFRQYCGTIDISSAKKDKDDKQVTVLFEAIDLRLPKVEIKTLQAATLANKRIVIHIDSWPRYSPYPLGHYVKTLGPIGDINVEGEALLIQHGISYEPFTQGVLNCLPTLPWIITEDDLLRRRDIRSLRVFSIDPPGCTDIDDALHVRILSNGNYEFGVHIADVSHFVKEGSLLDREAGRRGNTVYLVDRRIDMIPGLLSTDLCSLKPHVDRFAFSVIWELTPEANIVSAEFCKSIIKSVEAFTYAQAQARIDDLTLTDQISIDLRNLLNLSKILRQRRIEKGALSLSSPQVKFKKDEENQEPVDVELYELRETNSLVEEFMLLANIEVAKQILKFFPAFALLRRHPPPKMKQFTALSELIHKMGMTLNMETSKSLSESLDKAVKQGDPYFNELLRILTTRCMTQALYFSSGTIPQSQFYHYGLACPIYTHFTSPIRRYADVVVHRLLAAAIGAAPLPSILNKGSVQHTCNNINRRGRMADIAARDSTRLNMLIYFKNKVLRESSRVIQVRANGFTVLVPRYGVEGKVYLVDSISSKDMWKYNSEKKIIVSPDNKYQIQIFDIVEVEIRLDESRAHAPRVVFTCIDPPIHQATVSKVVGDDNKRKANTQSKENTPKKKPKV